MNKVLVIVKKELKRFFSDRRLVLQTVVFPGLMVYIMYSFLGNYLFSQTETEEMTIQAVVENLPASMEIPFESVGFEWVESTDQSTQIQQIEKGELDAYIIFPEDFDEMIQDNKEIAEVEIYFNGAEDNSSFAYEFTTDYLETYEESIVNLFNVNSDQNKVYNLMSLEDITGQILSSILPMLIILFVFSGAMALAPESIAGEKERGTLSTMLVTPLKRTELAFGKVISLTFMTTLAALSSTTGVLLSLPKLFVGLEVSLSSYTVMDAAYLFISVLSLVPLIVAGMLLISTYAKNVKEATTAVTPLMLVAVIGAMGPMFGGSEIWTACIPMYNVSMIINDLLVGTASISYLSLTVAMNLLYTVILLGALIKMLNSEKWMFN